MSEVAVLAIVGITLLLMLVRPFGVAEAWVALAGALMLLAIRAVPVQAVPDLIGETSNVLLFLAGMLLLTGIAERAGVFALLAEECARLARGRGHALFACLFALAAIVTATLSLDVTVIMLTPLIHALTSRRKIDPLPFLFSCVFVANTASLALPISNLTNLLVYARLDLTFGGFLRVMWLPNLVSMIVNLLIFLWIFRKQIPTCFPEIQVDRVTAEIRHDRWLIATGTVVLATLIAIFALGLANRPLWWASASGAVPIALPATRTHRLSLRLAIHDLSLSIFIFIVGMTVVVDAFQRSWLDGRSLPLPHGIATAVMVGVTGGAIGSNIVNNVPMTILALPIIERAAPAVQHALTYGTLVGTNIGPALTTYGSLATMLWLTMIRRRGVVISTREYMRVSLATIPAVLVATGVTLLLVLLV